MLNEIDNEQRDSLAFIGRSVKGFAHNINTPLSAVMGRAEMLGMRFEKLKDALSENSNKDELEKCIRDIRLILENCCKVANILKNAMHISIQAEKEEVQSLNIAKLLQEELEFLNADMEFKHSIEKEYAIDDDIPLLEGVYVHFSNSFLEIIKNCKDAMQNETVKKLSISLVYKKPCIEVQFHDTGSGMQEQQRKRIVEVLNASGNAAPEHDMNKKKGINRIARLLRPYKAQFDITSKPGDTTFRIVLPLLNADRG